jgi:hypothetical protein
MNAGAHIAIITILVIVVGVFLLVTVRGFAPPSGGNGPPPLTGLADYIRAVQTASAALRGATQTLTAATAGAPGLIGTTFARYDSAEGVEDTGPAALRAGADASIAKTAKILGGYSESVAAFNETVQAWTAATDPYKLMGQKSAAGALQANVVNPMAEFLNTAGQLSTFANAWTTAYQTASEGGACGGPAACALHHQSCVGGRCAATMNGAMAAAVGGIVSEVVVPYVAQGTLASSPYQELANDLNTAFMAMFYYIAGAPGV